MPKIQLFKGENIMTELLLKFKDSYSKPLTIISGGLSIPFGKVLDVLYGSTVAQCYTALIIMTILDWVTGTKAAKKDGIHTSDYGRAGVSRTFVIISFPALGFALDQIIGTNGYIFYFFIGTTLYNTWLSFTANVARAGWDKLIPTNVLNIVADEIRAKTQRAQQRKESLGITEPNIESQDTPAS